jgi:spermidine synthase
MGVSGAAALAWQMLWTAQWGRVLGHEIVAVLGVVAAIFAGMAVGAALLAGRIESSRHPVRWYVALEALLGLWGLVLLLAGPLIMDVLPALMGPQPPVWLHWVWAFSVPGLLLLPCSAAMGATLPALLAALRQRAPGDLSMLYAGNTAGAVLGVLATTFGIIPLLGLMLTGLLAAGLNLLCAAAAGLLWRQGRWPQTEPAAAAATVLESASMSLSVSALASTSPPDAAGRSAALVLLAVTGLLGIGYETLCVRVLSQVTENTVYSYALLLAVFLTGTALGASRQARRDEHHAPAQAVRWLLLAMLPALLLGGLGMWWADLLVLGPTRAWGGGSATALLGETLAALATMLAPTLVMGGLFSAACRQAQAAGLALGRAIAVNTLAAACAPALVGVWLFPQLGAARLWLLLVLAYGGLAVWRLERRRTLAVVFALACAALVAAVLPELRFVDLDTNARLVWFRDGVMGTVSITADARGIKHLRINNRIQEGSSASSTLETRLALLPLLTHPQPRKALFLGLGTGATAHVAAQMADLDVDVVELLPEVVEASRLFMAEPTAPRPQHPPHVMVADARRFVQATTGRYDVIVADLFHPARSGAGALYTVEHFEAVKRRLAAGGVFCQWVALHQMELTTFDSIVAAFAEAFPQGQILLASNSLDSPVVGLWASADGTRPRFDQVERALARSPAELRPRLQQARLTDAYAVLGSWLGSVRSWRAGSPEARPNRDDLPLVAHLAPWDDYAPRNTPRQRLATLLQRFGPAEPASPPAFLADVTPPEQAQALANYCSARDRYLQLGLTLEREADPRRLLQKLEPALTDLQHLSPRFSPANEALAVLRSAAGLRP